MFLRHNQFSIALFVVIFLLCLLPGSEVPKLGQEHLDKFLHFMLFGLFSFCTMVGVTKQYQFPVLSSNVVKFTIVFSIIYGVTIEVFQGLLLEGRGFEWLDIAADTAGVFIGYFFFLVMMGKKSGAKFKFKAI
ncbi:MAG: VanZ family protein [Saprospiraceae bacterium]|jgi:VanZ family protein